MSQSTAPAKKLTAQSRLSIELMLGAGNGMSQMDLAFEALTAHRDYYLEQMFIEIKNGEYENAHSHYKNFKDLTYMLDQLTLDVADLALRNHDVIAYNGDLQAQGKYVDAKAKLREESYKEFLEMILCVTPDETE